MSVFVIESNVYVSKNSWDFISYQDELDFKTAARTYAGLKS